jgi:Fur family peroxide stress response transcriptional regulator
MNEITTILPARFKRSRQRQRILELLQSVKNHPTAEWLYNTLRPRLTSLSQGTVYRNLKILEEQGLIRRIGGISGVDRFDGRLEPHSHFICQKCGLVEDVEMNLPIKPIQDLEVRTGHVVESQRLEFWGICKRCRNQNWY